VGVRVPGFCTWACVSLQTLNVDLVPRRFFDWRNKPQRNRIVADFAGFSSEVAHVVLSPGKWCGTLEPCDVGGGMLEPFGVSTCVHCASGRVWPAHLHTDAHPALPGPLPPSLSPPCSIPPPAVCCVYL
jgi:hypothetical protein